MVRQLLLAFSFAAYLAALIPLVVPNTLLAQTGASSRRQFSGAALASQALSELSETTTLETTLETTRKTIRETISSRCGCKKIAPGFCFLDPSCGVVVADAGRGGSHVRLGEPLYYGDYLASPYRPPIRLKILETGYSLLPEIGREEPGYGLYSYAITVINSSRSVKFLTDMFLAIPPVEDTAAQRSQTNIFYIPIRNDKVNEFEVSNEYGNFSISDRREMEEQRCAEGFSKVDGICQPNPRPVKEKQRCAEGFSRVDGVCQRQPNPLAVPEKDLYDYKIARTLLDHLCNSPAEEIKAVCDGDLSRGPFVFTYANPASNVTPVPAPFLFMDLSGVHERAFPEIIAAFRAQVKRDDISDRAKIDTLRLKLLNIVLTAADFVAPVHKAMADIVHIASGQAEEDKK